jgi:two-component system, cell cycle sensor histidine kinase and response regulator CckA
MILTRRGSIYINNHFSLLSSSSQSSSEETLELPGFSWNEADRLTAIEAYGILDTPREEDFDNIAKLAAEICNVPIAIVNIVAEGRQWFKAKVGLDIQETPLVVSICKYTIVQRGVLVIPDITKDERFRDNPLVTGEPHLRFYAGAVLETPEGLPIGTMCVLDYRPRELTDKEALTLKILARQVMIQLELRRLLKAKSRSEEQLRSSVDALGASELSYRRLFEAAQDGVLILDARNGRIDDVNPFLMKLLNFSRSEMVGKTVGELSPFKDIESNQAMLERVQKQGYARYEDLPLKTSDGRSISVEFVCNVYQAGDRKVIQCNIRDITERKRTEALFRRLVDSNAQGVVFWNMRGDITGANDAFLRLMRYDRDDLAAGLITRAKLTPPEYAELDRRAIDQMIATGVCVPYEKEYVRKDGSRVPVIIGASVFEDSKEEGVAFVIDLTEPKKLEQQFLRAQRMESIGTLAGGIAHDLNNILSPILMSIEVLKLTASDPTAKKTLETIEVSCKRGADIVRQVLSFARGAEGERIEIHLKHLLNDLENIIKDTFPKNIRLQFSIPDDIWTIFGDPTQAHQILLNLCVNARDAMPNGGSLVVTVENCVLDEKFAAMNPPAKAGRYVQIDVADSGTGMPAAVLDRIFEPFFTTKELNNSTGLGLSTVMGIVKSHHGIINVDSELGRGTTFKIYLPAMAIPSETTKESSELVSLPRGNGETILVVDDEVSILNIASRTLQTFGYRVLTATDGAKAVAIYAQHLNEIAVVLTDMAMPRMDGPLTIRGLTQINPRIKIIPTSGLNANDKLAKASGTSAKYFLPKPYTAATLLKAIQAILEEPPD